MGGFCLSCKNAYHSGAKAIAKYDLQLVKLEDGWWIMHSFEAGGEKMVGPAETSALAVLKLIKPEISKWMG